MSEQMFNHRHNGITCRVCGVQVTPGTQNTHRNWHIENHDTRLRQPLDTDFPKPPKRPNPMVSSR